MLATENSTTPKLDNFQKPNSQVSENAADLIFPTIHRGYLNEYRLFHYLYKTIPNKVSENNIDINRARRWFMLKYGRQIQDSYFNKINTGNGTESYDENFIYLLSPDLMVYFDPKAKVVRYLFNKTDLDFMSKLINGINAFKCVKSEEAEIFLLVMNGNFFDIESFKLKQPSFTIEENYNDDLMPVHRQLLKRLNTDNDKGIVLLHGDPGTGKTSYLRYLTTTLNKKVIFFPPNLAESITHPNLITILIENPNSILVIEDAENVLLDRNHNDKSAVSALLNLSDGLLSDCLGIQIVCTFNTDVAEIDPALLRKGRLITSYKFEALETDKAQRLSDKLGFTSQINSSMRLTDIYNQDETEQPAIEKIKIGFKAN
jgi:hypothetical protein